MSDRAGSPAHPAGAPDGSRITWVDALRGIAMLLMLLDHARFFFVQTGFDPLDPYRTSLPLYLTRWITHLAAPAFVFLAGAAAFLRRERERDPGRTARSLAARGLLLLVLEFTVVAFCWRFRLGPPFVFQVIGVLGLSLLVLAGLLCLRPAVVLAMGAGILLLQPLLELVPAAAGAGNDQLLKFLTLAVPVRLGEGILLEVVYPFLPWFGVFLAGYGSARYLGREPAWLTRRLLRLALVACGVFLVVRLAGGIGNARPWVPDADGLVSLFAFLDVAKYPPDWAFLCLTAAALALLAAALVGREGRLVGWLAALGREPLFFYLLHLPLLHLGALVAFRLHGIPVVNLFEEPALTGFPLALAWLAAAAALLVLVPACRRFHRRRRQP